MPPSADAFWGEDSGAIHAVLPVPQAVGRQRVSARRIAACGLLAVACGAALVGKLGGLPGGHSPSMSSSAAIAGFMDLAELRGAVGVPQVTPQKHGGAAKPRAVAASARRAPGPRAERNEARRDALGGGRDVDPGAVRARGRARQLEQPVSLHRNFIASDAFDG